MSLVGQIIDTCSPNEIQIAINALQDTSKKRPREEPTPHEFVVPDEEYEEEDEEFEEEISKPVTVYFGHEVYRDRGVYAKESFAKLRSDIEKLFRPVKVAGQIEFIGLDKKDKGCSIAIITFASAKKRDAAQKIIRPLNRVFHLTWEKAVAYMKKRGTNPYYGK